MYVAVGLIFFVLFVLIFAPKIGLNMIFLVLGGVIVWAIIMRNKAIKKNINKVSEKALHVVNLERGGVFEIRNVGENMEDMTLTVLAKHLYQEGDFSWFELECDKGSGEKVWVEVEDDDETQVSVVLKKMKLSDTNLTAAYLDTTDEEETGQTQFDGRIYKYEESDKAVFYRFCDDAKPETLYYWDFINGNKILSVEKWGEKDYEVFLSQIMRPSQITVLRNNA